MGWHRAGTLIILLVFTPAKWIPSDRENTAILLSALTVGQSTSLAGQNTANDKLVEQSGMMFEGVRELESKWFLNPSGAIM